MNTTSALINNVEESRRTTGATDRGPSGGDVDFTLMYAFHEAFRRDLSRLTGAVNANRGSDPAVRAGWDTLKKQLQLHHTSENTSLWPPLRAKLSNVDQLAVIDQMEAEHAYLDPLVEAVDAALENGQSAGANAAAEALVLPLCAHMDHEEEQALPLIASYLGPNGWDAFRADMRKTHGIKGGAVLFPWMLDGASAKTSSNVLRFLPLPARILYRLVWRPNYARTPRW